MLTMVFDVPAVSGGALTILNQYYETAKSDLKNEWIFIVSTPKLNETPNVKVLNFPWVKKSWFHRLYFDRFVAHNLVKKYKVNEVLSLQNIIIPKVKVKQTVYVHQSLPFSNFKFNIFKNFKLWVYQNVIGKLIFKSIKKADQVIVQTNWMKKACLNNVRNLNENKIRVIIPQIDIKPKGHFNNTKENMSMFFYPANGDCYKNHLLLIEVSKKLKLLKVDNIKMIFTLRGNENNFIMELYKIVNDYNLNIDFIGKLTREKVFEFYTKSILIFPSIIETVGLPLLEAKLHNTPILVSDCEYSHEILADYEYAYYFDPFDKDDLYEKIISISFEETNSL